MNKNNIILIIVFLCFASLSFASLTDNLVMGFDFNDNHNELISNTTPDSDDVVTTTGFFGNGINTTGSKKIVFNTPPFAMTAL